MATPEVVALHAQISALSPPQKLRLAADLLDAKRPELAHAIIDRVAVELGAALMLRSAKGG